MHSVQVFAEKSVDQLDQQPGLPAVPGELMLASLSRLLRRHQCMIFLRSLLVFFYVFVFIGHFFYCPDCCDTVNRRYPCQLFFHSTPRILPPLHPLRWHYQYRLSLWTSLLLSWIIQESVRPLWWYLSVLDEYVISYEKTENFALCHLVACPCHISCLNVCGCCFKVYDDEGVMVMDMIIYS